MINTRFHALQATLTDAIEIAMTGTSAQIDERLWLVLELFIPNWTHAGLEFHETIELSDFLETMIIAHILQPMHTRPCLIEGDHQLFTDEDRHAA